jgi:CubicO group peptidase (beta-lactamase class C family)
MRPDPSPTDALRQATRRYLRAYPDASLCAGLTRRGEHHVVTLRGQGAPPAADALFSLGPLTQVFTGCLLALLVDRGESRLDTPLHELIPRPLLPDEAAGRITLEQLATHTAGLPDEPPNLESPHRDAADPYGHYSASLFGDFLRGYTPALPPPRPHAESLLGMGVLGHALSRRVRLNYGHAVRDLLCTPLGLGDTTFRPSETQAPRLLTGHSGRGDPLRPWTFPALPGAASLHSTVPDLLRFLDANLGRGEAGLVRALRLAHAPRAPRRGGSVGLGWNVSTTRGRTRVWRASTLGGFTGFLGFSPETDTGVVLLSNQGPAFLDTLLRRVPLAAPGLALLKEGLP